MAAAEVGASEGNSGCLKYGPCTTYAWCAMFVEWVWRTAGVTPVPDTWMATGIGKWGAERGLFKRGAPQPGDIAVYGEPGIVSGGHVAIVESIHGDGTITTVGGNESSAVRRRTINPATERSGADNVLISGYVSPPGVEAFSNGSAVARNNGDGTYLEAVVAGGRAFAVSQADKADLGLGQATVIATDVFNRLLAARVDEGTVIAKRTDAGTWMEAVVAGGKAFVLSAADKTSLSLGQATGVPARSFNSLIDAEIGNGTVIAKRTDAGAWMEAVVVGGKAFVLSAQEKSYLGLGAASRVTALGFDGLINASIGNGAVVAKRTEAGTWMEAIVVGGRAFVLSAEDKTWLGLGAAAAIPAGAFDAYVSATIAERTVIARRNQNDTYLEAYIVNGRAVGLTSEVKAELALGAATVIPTAAFNAFI